MFEYLTKYEIYDIININPGVAIDLKSGFDVLLLPSLVDIYNNDVNDVEHENDRYNTSAPTTIHATWVASSILLFYYYLIAKQLSFFDTNSYIRERDR